MRPLIPALLGLSLLAGCATQQQQPPAPGSAASKVSMVGEMDHLRTGAMRVARENGFLTVKAEVINTSTRNQQLYYRFSWLGSDGFPVSEDETWKSLPVYGAQSIYLQGIAPTPKATDFRIEMHTPENTVNLLR